MVLTPFTNMLFRVVFFHLSLRRHLLLCFDCFQFRFSSKSARHIHFYIGEVMLSCNGLWFTGRTQNLWWCVAPPGFSTRMPVNFIPRRNNFLFWKVSECKNFADISLGFQPGILSYNWLGLLNKSWISFNTCNRKLFQ